MINAEQACALRRAIDLVEATWHTRSCAGIKSAVLAAAPACVCQVAVTGGLFVIDRARLIPNRVIGGGSSARAAWLDAADFLVREFDSLTK